jgi:hypothetical protein
VLRGGVTLKTILQQYEKSRSQETFENTSYVCGICMEEKKGESCTKLDKCGVSKGEILAEHSDSFLTGHKFHLSMSFAKSA